MIRTRKVAKGPHQRRTRKKLPKKVGNKRLKK